MDYIEIKAKVKPAVPGNDLWISFLGEIGFESFVEEEEEVNAYAREDVYDREALASVVARLSDNFTIEYKESKIQDRNWNEEWEKSYASVKVEDKCIIRAPFHAVDKAYQYDILIDPKMSFGTGHHETTYLCTNFLADMELKGKEVLDMGCGTGVLAILAAKKGAARVVAIDNNEWAYNNTLENITMNNCPDIEVLEGDAALLEGMPAFDLIVANINRNILLNDIPSYAKVLKGGGDLVMSGFYEMDIDAIKEKAESCGLGFIGHKTKNDWAFVMFEKLKN